MPASTVAPIPKVFAHAANNFGWEYKSVALTTMVAKP